MGMRSEECTRARTDIPFSGTTTMSRRHGTWYEFFAGAGMARLGLGSGWTCTFANDISEKKASAYRGFFGSSPELKVTDVAQLTTRDLPGRPDLVWASFPCQDLSLAGSGAGLRGKRSGTFRPFWALVRGMVLEERAPKIVVLENVTGTLSSHAGSDFASIVRAFADCDYRVGAVVINAAMFLPQSRPRLFVIGVRGGSAIPAKLKSVSPTQPWHTRGLVRAYNAFPNNLAQSWVWWTLPIPKEPAVSLAGLIEDTPAWHSESDTRRLLQLMDPAHRERIAKVSRLGSRQVGTLYKRTRPDSKGVMRQRAEVRFDGISGCLRTPVGGSSRQTVIVTSNGTVRTRLLAPREAARLMGVPEEYRLPPGYNDAYHLLGDGVVVPAVSWLERHILRPLAVSQAFEQVA